jgi:PPOX class probable F420-dependent enzyme
VPRQDKRLQALVKRPYLAILATIYPSGSPQAFPVWYEYDGDYFLVTTSAKAVKVGNIQRHPKVALCITNTSTHTDVLTIRGTAELVLDNTLAHQVHTRLSVRYLGKRAGIKWDKSVSHVEMVLIKIKPDKLIWSG